MKIKLLLFCLTSCLFFLTTQAQNFDWARSIGGNGYDFGNSIKVDASGNIYTTGHFEGTVDFDPGAGTTNLTSSGSKDVFVQKLDPSGNFVWAKSFGGSSFDNGVSIQVDASGNIYTTGYFEGTVDFDPGAGTTNLTSAGYADIFVQKLDPSGNLIWAKSFGGSSDDGVFSIKVDASGNIYTLGGFQGTVDFDPGAGTTNLTSAGNADIFVQKLDPSGNFIWAKSFGGSSFDTGFSITVDASGNVFSTGRFIGITDFDPGAGTANLTSSSGGYDVFVQKLDASGNFLWAKSFGGYSYEVGHSITIDASGNVYTTGLFNANVDFDPGTGTSYLSSNGSSDIFIQKLDASGNFIWAKSFGGSFTDIGYSNTVDASGNVYSTGRFVGTVDFDPGAGTANLSSSGLAGLRDVFVQKLDPSGNFLWAKSFGGSSNDEPRSITVDASGNVYTLGYFQDTIDFDPGAATAIHTSAGTDDIFIHKMSQVGTTGILELSSGIEVKTFPNPTTGLVQISFAKAFSNVEITLTNIQGQVVFTKQLNVVANKQINIEGSPGIYFLNVRTEKGQSVIKLVKE